MPLLSSPHVRRVRQPLDELECLGELWRASVPEQVENQYTLRRIRDALRPPSIPNLGLLSH